MKYIALFLLLGGLVLSEAFKTPAKCLKPTDVENDLEDGIIVGDKCSVCKKVGKVLKKALELGINVATIELAADYVCGLLAKEIPVKMCHDALVKLFDHGLDEIKKHTPEEVCKKIHLC